MQPNNTHYRINDEESLRLLPGKISKISSQKKSSTRFSVFINDAFLIGISDSTLTKFKLRKDMLLTKDTFLEIAHHEQYWKIREYLIGLLSRRDHARNELQQKALRKGYAKTTISPILDELTEKGYINNLVFAKKFVHDKFEFQKWGRNKIRTELIKKGVSSKEIDISLNAISKSESIKSIEQLIQKNRSKFLRANSEKRKKKIFDFLLRKGYDSDSIIKVLNKLDIQTL